MTALGLHEQQLQKMQIQSGFIVALDQSGGSTPNALRLYGIKEGAWSNAKFNALLDARIQSIFEASNT